LTQPVFEEEITPELIERYDLRVPRYTSYPTVPNWNKEFKTETYRNMLQRAAKKEEPLSLYFHIPFCIRRCLFCACNVLVTQREDRPRRYLSYLKHEIRSVSRLLESRKDVIQLHLGGGTPTHLTPAQLDDLFSLVWDEFEIQNSSEISIEIHPSVTSIEHLETLRDFGFNRISVGVQDFDPVVQERLNRFQTFEETSNLIKVAREMGFESTNADLIYGLPYQTDEGFDNTLEKIDQIKPDRIALYSYAHFPNIFRHHKHIPLTEIAQGRDKLQLFLDARKFLLSRGYRQIGFDHFALESDELWKSFENKTLRRNFMGFTTKSGTDLIAFGYSGISELSSGYSQNSKDMSEYEQMIEKYGIAPKKGHLMSPSDSTRKRLIMDFLCLGEIRISELERTDEGRRIIDSKGEIIRYFEKIGFLEGISTGWRATSLGRIFSRVIASSFDEYYDANRHTFSQTI